MRTKIILTIFAISLLLLVGCDNKPDQAGKSQAFLGGTQGLIATFEPFSVEEQGVYAVFDSDTFPIEVTLKNKGEYALKPRDVSAKLMGPSKDEFNGISSWELQNANNVDIISSLLPSGGEETLTFARDAKYKQAVKGSLDRNFFINLEYKYQTYLIIPDACLKEDLTDKRVCEVDGVKTFFVSGAPITVTSVEESSAGKGIMALKIKIKNAGIGKVTKVGEEFSAQQDKLAYTIDDSAWECKQGGKENEARLLNGEAEIFCKLKNALAKGTISTKQVKLAFDYKYRDTIQETLRIKESAK